MELTDEEIDSPILRARLVLELRIETAREHAWRAAPPRYESRTVEVTFRVTRVLKGERDDAPNQLVLVAIEQYRPAGSRFFAVPGVWSASTLTTGASFVAFCAGASANLATVLNDPDCFHVEPADAAAADTLLAHPDIVPAPALGTLLSDAAGQPRAFGVLFAGYLVDRVIETFYEDVDGFAQVLAAASRPKVVPQVALVLMRGIADALLRHEPAPDPFLAHYLVATADIVARPDQATLRTMLLNTYLPSLLGITGGLDPRPAGQVFSGDPTARATVRAAFAGLPEAATLLAWIDR